MRVWLVDWLVGLLGGNIYWKREEGDFFFLMDNFSSSPQSKQASGLVFFLIMPRRKYECEVVIGLLGSVPGKEIK